jgi:hypothetical protein
MNADEPSTPTSSKTPTTATSSRSNSRPETSTKRPFAFSRGPAGGPGRVRADDPGKRRPCHPPSLAGLDPGIAALEPRSAAHPRRASRRDGPASQHRRALLRHPPGARPPLGQALAERGPYVLALRERGPLDGRRCREGRRPHRRRPAASTRDHCLATEARPPVLRSDLARDEQPLPSPPQGPTMELRDVRGSSVGRRRLGRPCRAKATTPCPCREVPP